MIYRRADKSKPRRREGYSEKCSGEEGMDHIPRPNGETTMEITLLVLKERHLASGNRLRAYQ